TPKYCNFLVGITPAARNVPTAEINGATLADFGKVLSLALDRPVIDATGIPGRFDFHLEFAIDEKTPALFEMRRLVGEETVSKSRPSILTAIQQQYGLKLVPSQAPREFLVIDHVEKPALSPAF